MHQRNSGSKIIMQLKQQNPQSRSFYTPKVSSSYMCTYEGFMIFVKQTSNIYTYDKYFQTNAKL